MKLKDLRELYGNDPEWVAVRKRIEEEDARTYKPNEKIKEMLLSALEAFQK